METANDASACSFVGFTPSVLTVFAIWNPDAQGNPLPVPTFRGYPGGIGYSAHLFTRYMRAALAGTAAEKFPEAKDNGKIGGVDGTWGLGVSKRDFADDDSEVANGENKEDSSSSKDKDKENSASGASGANKEDSSSSEDRANGANGSGANGNNGSAGSGTTSGGSAGDGSGAASSSGSGGANQTQSGGD